MMMQIQGCEGLWLKLGTWFLNKLPNEALDMWHEIMHKLREFWNVKDLVMLGILYS